MHLARARLLPIPECRVSNQSEDGQWSAHCQTQRLWTSAKQLAGQAIDRRDHECTEQRNEELKVKGRRHESDHERRVAERPEARQSRLERLRKHNLEQSQRAGEQADARQARLARSRETNITKKAS